MMSVNDFEEVSAGLGDRASQTRRMTMQQEGGTIVRSSISGDHDSAILATLPSATFPSRQLSQLSHL
jgi:hypothetical protein